MVSLVEICRGRKHDGATARHLSQTSLVYRKLAALTDARPVLLILLACETLRAEVVGRRHEASSEPGGKALCRVAMHGDRDARGERREARVDHALHLALQSPVKVLELGCAALLNEAARASSRRAATYCGRLVERLDVVSPSDCNRAASEPTATRMPSRRSSVHHVGEPGQASWRSQGAQQEGVRASAHAEEDVAVELAPRVDRARLDGAVDEVMQRRG